LLQNSLTCKKKIYRRWNWWKFFAYCAI